MKADFEEVDFVGEATAVFAFEGPRLFFSVGFDNVVNFVVFGGAVDAGTISSVDGEHGLCLGDAVLVVTTSWPLWLGFDDPPSALEALDLILKIGLLG